jgi:hypothetical protein
MPSVSKTHYLLWRACPKNAWLCLHRPDFYYSTELSEYDRSVIDTGIEVERIARGLFAGGVLVGVSQTEAKQHTVELLALHIPTLFQPLFERDQLLAAIDVLRYDETSDDYSICEIKSSTKPKDEHLYDLAFQVLLLRQHGLNVSHAFIVHLNPNYVRHGDLDIQQLFQTADLTAQVDQTLEEVGREAEAARAYLLSEDEPEGPCSCIYKGRANHCSTFRYSNPDVPDYGVHDISHIGSSPRKLRELVDAGIFSLDKIPANVALTPSQKAQVSVYRSGETVIEKEAIAAELSELAFPLHFIDYETFSPAVPLFSQHCSYDQIPLQYSLHIVGSPEEGPIHLDFLYDGSNDPTTAFLTSLQQHVCSFGSIIVWNKGFESQVNDAIARRLPEVRDYVIDLNDRFYDLKDIFSKRYFIHKNLFGKVSIKNVLPVLAPHLSYSALEIHDGAAAANAWGKIISGEFNEQECAVVRVQLREYCALDSYGMYAIWRTLKHVTEA